MSSEEKGQLCVFTCDTCGETYEAAGAWAHVWQCAKDDGWRAFKDQDGDWQHVCPECRS